MNWRKIIFLGFMVIAIIFAMVWVNQQTEKAQFVENRNEAAFLPPSQPVVPSRKVEPSFKAPLKEEYSQISIKALGLKAAQKEYWKRHNENPQFEWKILINFYGKVIDQFGQPVVDASVSVSWVNLQGKQGVGETILKTNGLGLFNLQGVKGKMLSVRISKEEYYDMSLKENQNSFEYADPFQEHFHEPDPNRPAVFKMRKKGELPKLVVKSVQLNLKGQGVSETLDFQTGKVVPSGGQLEVMVWKPEITVQQINEGRVFPYDWAITVKVNGGGVLEHKDPFPFEAPTSGYQPSFQLREHVTNGADGGFVNKQFYFYYGQPVKYGRMTFRTNSDQGSIFIDYWLNPSGSRNLEYDPKAGNPP